MSLHDEPSSQGVGALSHAGASIRQISPASIQAAIDRTFHRMMTATTDAEQRAWCDRMKYWIARLAA